MTVVDTEALALVLDYLFLYFRMLETTDEQEEDRLMRQLQRDESRVKDAMGQLGRPYL